LRLHERSIARLTSHASTRPVNLLRYPWTCAPFSEPL
jgi:hypothetical protein